MNLKHTLKGGAALGVLVDQMRAEALMRMQARSLNADEIVVMAAGTSTTTVTTQPYLRVTQTPSVTRG